MSYLPNISLTPLLFALYFTNYRNGVVLILGYIILQGIIWGFAGHYPRLPSLYRVEYQASYPESGIRRRPSWCGNIYAGTRFCPLGRGMPCLPLYRC